MLPNVMILAERLWPKASDVEFDLLAKILVGVPEDQAKGLLEEARIDSKYNSIPLKAIKAAAAKVKSSGKASDYIDCWAVHYETKKYKECCVLASDNYGATVMMQQYLKNRCHVEPTDYVIFVGKENFKAFWDYRMGKTEAPINEEF